MGCHSKVRVPHAFTTFSCVPITNTILFPKFFLYLAGMLAVLAPFGVLHEGLNVETYWDAL